MHSFILLTLISSVFALPIGPDLINAPAKIIAPVDAYVRTNLNAAVPVEAAVGNVGLSDVNMVNDDISGNKVALKRDIANIPIDVTAPVDAAVGVATKVIAPVTAAVANVGLEKVNIANGILSNNTVIIKRDIVNTTVGIVKAPVDTVVKIATSVVAPVKTIVGDFAAKTIKGLNGNAAATRLNVHSRRRLVNIPTNVDAPVNAAVKVAANVIAPVTAKVANVGLDKVAAGNDVASGNVIARDTGLALPALPAVLGSAQANATKVVANIQSLLASSPAGGALAGPMSELNGIVTSATNQLSLLNGLGLGAIMQDGEASVSTQQVSQTVTGFTQTVSGVVQQVTAQVGTEVPELQPVITLLNGSLHSLLSTVTSLVPGLAAELTPLLSPLSNVLNTLGLGAGLNVVGV